MVPMRITWRLVPLLAERHLTQRDLAQKTGVSEKRIGELCAGAWTRVSGDILGKFSAVLGVGVGDLLEFVPQDVWFPIRHHGQLTVHLGSTSLEVATQQGVSFPRLGIGTWDVRAFFRTSQFLNSKSVRPIAFDYEEHLEERHDPTGVDALFASGNHLILGSPLVNPIAEDAVCRGFGIPPRDRTHAQDFPYRFRWDRTTQSSFGEFAGSSEPGIVARGSRQPIALRTVIAEGDDGQDCGLVFTYRYNPNPRGARRESEDEDRIVIAVLGYSGLATDAGTALLFRDDVACELYPSARDSAVLRAFRARYRRSSAKSGLDDREPVSAELIPVA